MHKTPAVSARHSPKENYLLAALPAADYERLLPDLELVPLPLGWVVYEAGGKLGYVYFPTSSIIFAPLRHGGRGLGGDRRHR